MAELKRASCIRCGYRSGIITFGSARKERYNGWPALDKSTNQVIEVDLLTNTANQAHALYFYNAEASKKYHWIKQQLFTNGEEAYKHKCPRCGNFDLVFKLEALAD